MKSKPKLYFAETRAIFFRVCIYVAIDKYSSRVSITSSELYEYAGSFYFMRGVDVSRVLNKFPEIKCLDKKTAIKMLRNRSPRLLKLAYVDKFELYYKRGRAKCPDAELDLIVSK